MPRNVSLSAFPKSGVTYLSSLLFFALFPDADPAEIERRYVIDIHINSLERATPAQGCIFYKSHLPFNATTPLCRNADRAIYLIRDPIDIMRSAFDFTRLTGERDAEATLDEFIDKWLASEGGSFDVAGPWPRHVRLWMEQSLVPVHLVRYRDLVDAPEAQLRAILEFLKLDDDPAAIRNAVANSTMTAMRAREEEEFRAKRAGVFYSKEVESGMIGGARFINKGHRFSYDSLSERQKIRADEVFGDVCRRYLR